MKCNNKTRLRATLLLVLALHMNMGSDLRAEESSIASGVIVDALGSPVEDAAVQIFNAQGEIVQATKTDPAGAFLISEIPYGAFELRISARGFQAQRMNLGSGQSPHSALRIVLNPAILHSEVSVTASRGAVEEIRRTPQVVNVKNREEINRRPLVTIGNALEGTPGALIQQSTYGQASPFLRGLTGNQVLNLVDGVRFNNSIYRFGPNQYLALLEPSQVQRVESMLGPTGSQYGSDALGGTINVITVQPRYGSGSGFALHGELNVFGGSADASGGANTLLSLGNKRLSWLVGATGRRHNDLRPGGGRDSHHAFHRYFGLNETQIKELFGTRLQDTGFTQLGGHSKVALLLPSDQNVTLWYEHSEQTGVRGYKDLQGGQGQLQSSFEPQVLNFFYARYEKSKLGRLDSLMGTFSVNSQRDGSMRQGLRLGDAITRDYSRVNSYGYAIQAMSHIGNRQAVVFGSEAYQEHIHSARLQQNPMTGQSTEKRALYPNGSNYTTYGLFGQDSFELVRGKLRTVFGGRYTEVRFETFAERNRDSSNRSLGVVDSSQSFRDLTFHTSLAWQMTPHLGLNALAGRGFRAPNLNDLGAIGLNDLGYEVPATEVTTVGGLVGTNSAEGALPTGKAVEKLRAEKLYNSELGITFQNRRLYSRVNVFDAELLDPIVRRTLLFPSNHIPAFIAGIPVLLIPPTPAQRSENVVTVATNLDSRAVKAFVNEGRQRFYGLESLAQYSISPNWAIDANYTFLAGRDLNPNRAMRRLPPQQGVVSLRFTPSGSRLWMEIGGTLAGPQERLNGGDLGDERIGAERSRRDISAFFLGARVSPYLRAGSDGLIGTSDDIFSPTLETLSQIQDRVLPLGAIVNVKISDDNTRVPLFLRTAGYFSLNLSVGIRLGEKSSLDFAVRNLLDKNYRIHGSGVDSPGINLYIGYRFRF